MEHKGISLDTINNQMVSDSLEIPLTPDIKVHAPTAKYDSDLTVHPLCRTYHF